jgi:hypothetical protein
MTFTPWESVNHVQVATVSNGNIVATHRIPFYTATEADAWVMADVVAGILAREQGGRITDRRKRDFPTEDAQ